MRGRRHPAAALSLEFNLVSPVQKHSLSQGAKGGRMKEGLCSDRASCGYMGRDITFRLLDLPLPTPGSC